LWRVVSPAPDDHALVLTFDGKGIVMIPGGLRPATAKAAAAAAEGRLATRLSPGEKNGRKRMAELACVYDAVLVPRTPEDIISAPAKKKRGKRRRKRRPASRIARGNAGSRRRGASGWPRRSPMTSLPSSRTPSARRNAATRITAGPGCPRGRQQRADRGRHQRGREPRGHGDDRHRFSSTCWNTAGRPPGPSSARASPPPRNGSRPRPARSCTAGRAKSRPGSAAAPPSYGYCGPERVGADECARYLENKDRYLDYATALAKGWPIATGIIEGACSHIVKDRMDITGARWGLEGAEAIL